MPRWTEVLPRLILFQGLGFSDYMGILRFPKLSHVLSCGSMRFDVTDETVDAVLLFLGLDNAGHWA